MFTLAALQLGVPLCDGCHGGEHLGISCLGSFAKEDSLANLGDEVGICADVCQLDLQLVHVGKVTVNGAVHGIPAAPVGEAAVICAQAVVAEKPLHAFCQSLVTQELKQRGLIFIWQRLEDRGWVRFAGHDR